MRAELGLLCLGLRLFALGFRFSVARKAAGVKGGKLGRIDP